MSYRCGACGTAVAPGQPRLVATALRVVPAKVRVIGSVVAGIKPVIEKMPGRTEIAGEIPVCRSCHAKWKLGATVDDLIRDAEDRRRMKERREAKKSAPAPPVEDVFDFDPSPPEFDGEVQFGNN